MTDLDASVREVLTSDWQSTRRIADAIPIERRSRDRHHAAVRSHLLKLERYGEIESRKVMEPNGWTYEWRNKV